MAQVERVREVPRGALSSDYLRQREAAGWKLAAIEWERAVEPGEGAFAAEEAPFGARAASDPVRLQEDPGEMNALVRMMELIIQEGPYSRVAEEMNREGFRTRRGTKWDAVGVFNMLPRLIEAGPRIFSRPEWRARGKAVRSIR
jgi:hypothetical protein